MAAGSHFTDTVQDLAEAVGIARQSCEAGFREARYDVAVHFPLGTVIGHNQARCTRGCKYIDPCFLAVGKKPSQRGVNARQFALGREMKSHQTAICSLLSATCFSRCLCHRKAPRYSAEPLDEGLPRLHPAVERLVIFGDLPFADARFADEQDEGARRGDLLGKLCGPRAARAQVRRRGRRRWTRGPCARWRP